MGDHEFEFSDVTSAAGEGGVDSGNDGRLRQPEMRRMSCAARLGERSHRVRSAVADCRREEDTTAAEIRRGCYGP